MTQFYVMVRLNAEPGSAVTKAYINAENSYAAIQMARAMYGRLLLSESAMSV